MQARDAPQQPRREGADDDAEGEGGGVEDRPVEVDASAPAPPDQSPDGTFPASKMRFKPTEFITQLGQDMQATIRSRFRNLQGTLHTQIKNLKNNVANLNYMPNLSAEELRHRQLYHYDHSDLKIRSVRKLFDVIEQRYSWVSILVLLTNVGLEAAAFGIYLQAQRAHVPQDWRDFEWGTGYFIAEVLLSVIFMSSWVALLSVEPKKMAYAFNVRSLMSILSAGWMLILGFGALLTENKAWTRVYAPMFLRLWWLHEGLLTVLSYPQISVWFTENRLEMLRSMIQCIAVIGISVGILQAVESFFGDPIEYFDMVYMMLLAFSTIGYGDVVPLTVEGRLLMIIFIGVGLSYFVPILEYVADLGVRHLFYRHYTTWFKRSNHIVMCGNLGYNELRMHLKNILAGDRYYLNMNVVILLADQPSPAVELLLNSPKYRSTVHLLVGDPANPADLDRCNARGAAAIFLYGAGTHSSYYSDYDLAKQTMTAHIHVPMVPLYVLMHRSRYIKSLMPRSTNVLEFERLGHNLLGLGCVLPGMIPFLANLIRMFDPMTTETMWELSDFKDLFGLSGSDASLRALRKMWTRKRDMLTYGAASIELGIGAEPDWMSVYEASLAQHLDQVDAPAVVQEGHYTFHSLARLLYRTDITLLGVERPADPLNPTPTATVVELGPRRSLVGVLRLIVICDARRKAQDIIDEIVLDALTNPTTAGTPERKHSRRKNKGGKSSSHNSSSHNLSPPSPPPPLPANVHATSVTVVPVPSRENTGDVLVNTSLHPGALPNATFLPQPTPPPANSAAATVPSSAPDAPATLVTTIPTTKAAPVVSPTSAAIPPPRRESDGVSNPSPAGLNSGGLFPAVGSPNGDFSAAWPASTLTAAPHTQAPVLTTTVPPASTFATAAAPTATKATSVVLPTSAAILRPKKEPVAAGGLNGTSSTLTNASFVSIGSSNHAVPPYPSANPSLTSPLQHADALPAVHPATTLTPTVAKTLPSNLGTSAVVLRPKRDFPTGVANTSLTANTPPHASPAAPHPPIFVPPTATPTSRPFPSVSSGASLSAVAPAVSPTESLRRSHPGGVVVSLSNPVATLALAAADDVEAEQEQLESRASPVLVTRAAARGMPRVSSGASVTSSLRGYTPTHSPPVAAQAKLSSATLVVPPPPLLRAATSTYGGPEEGYEASPSGFVSSGRTALKFFSNALHLQRHYVFIDLSSAHERTSWSREATVESRTAKAADYYDAMRPVRQHDPDSDIVLLANETNYDYLANMWEEEDVSGKLIVVQGSGLFTSDLRRANVSKAAAVVIFAAGDRCDEHGDSLSVLVMHLVRQLTSEERGGDVAADIPIVVEVDHAELVPFFATSYMSTGKNVQTSSEWVAEPSFMSGCVVCRHMLDTGLQEMYFTPLLHEVLEQILSSKSESLLVTLMAPDEAWRVYEDATAFGLENDLLPLAIHRFHQMISEENSVSFRYIITNPPPTFPLHCDDFIYCLKL